MWYLHYNRHLGPVACRNGVGVVSLHANSLTVTHVRLPHVTAASKPAPEKETVGHGAAHGGPHFRIKEAMSAMESEEHLRSLSGRLANESPRRGGRSCGGGFFHGGFPESVQALVLRVQHLKVQKIFPVY